MNIVNNMNNNVVDQVTEYVYTNYKSYVGKELIIKDMDSHFRIYKHKDSSPLILGKTILN
tara:strand:- start:319 stop:498 length:180 start_codon:yes stop_codon:yes gene_type:complete